ncbi:hypothetical protein [Qipengyuania vesicularis]|uniref:hypothetical protein n=1 Tax=Qipengyuania vesicularis TaxID=2867232 RepID=UPI001C86E0A5|nr:hypothetical protein [Qipengyuania vesicularis]MBX7526156.1 hypothetical protein [Qipengyuania vesicularis]
MKNILTLACALALLGCSQSEDAEPVAETAEPPEEFGAPDGGPAYGTFNVTLADGSTMIDEVRPDGTYTSTYADGTIENGTWVQKADAYCATADTEGASEICYPEKIDEGGVWTATTPEGEISVIERVETED